MQIWALTGGIASGKTTVANLFQQQGIPVVDADATYHRLIEPKDGKPAALALSIAEHFSGVLKEDGHVDRAVLAGYILNDPSKKALLEKLSHTLIQQSSQQQFQQLEQQRHAYALYDIPLLYEKNLEQHFQKVIVVWVTPQQQQQRLAQRLQLSLEDPQIMQRLAAQLPLAEKRQRAQQRGDYVIDNSGTLQQTVLQIQEIVRSLRLSV